MCLAQSRAVHGELSSCCSQPLPRDTQRCRAGALLAPKTSPDPLPSTAPGKIDQCAFIDHLYTPKKGGEEKKKKKKRCHRNTDRAPPLLVQLPTSCGGSGGAEESLEILGLGAGLGSAPPCAKHQHRTVVSSASPQAWRPLQPPGQPVPLSVHPSVRPSILQRLPDPWTAQPHPAARAARAGPAARC